ncbi:MAG: hypothetical protein WD448_07760, partial [Woeseia sp.]
FSGKKSIDMDVIHELTRAQEKGSLGIGFILMVIFSSMIVTATMWPARASLPVYFIAGLGLFLTSIQIARDGYMLRVQARTGKGPKPFTRAENLLEFNAWIWLAALVLGTWLLGFHLAFVIYPLLFGYIYGANLKNSLYIGIVALALCWMIFDYFIGAVWPNPLDTFIGDGLMSLYNLISDAVRGVA